MANSVPTLTNENFHMFEPSPIETSLAANVDNPLTPNASGLLFRYQTQNALNGSNYQSQVDQMHRAQIAEAMMAQQTARNTSIATSLKDAGATPGMVQAMISGGMVPPGMDLSAVNSGANAAAAAKNTNETLSGVGRAAGSGITGLAPLVRTVAGPGADQGPDPRVIAAGINAQGRIDASNAGGITVSGSLPGPNGERPTPFSPTYRGKVPPNAVPGLPLYMRGGNNMPTAPIDDGSNPLLGGIPGVVDPQLADKGAHAGPAGSFPAQPTTTKTLQQVQQSVAAMMPHLAATNAPIHTDIAAGAVNGVPNVVQSPTGGFAIKGASGKLYDANGF